MKVAYGKSFGDDRKRHFSCTGHSTDGVMIGYANSYLRPNRGDQSASIRPLRTSLLALWSSTNGRRLCVASHSVSWIGLGCPRRLFTSADIFGPMRDKLGIDAAGQPGVQRVSPKLTGVLERTFFCIAVGADINGALTAMLAWLALKLAANWQARADRGERLGINYTFSALLAGMLSLLIAMLVGCSSGSLHKKKWLDSQQL